MADHADTQIKKVAVAKPRLGRGLSSLITTSVEPHHAGTYEAATQIQAQAGAIKIPAGVTPQPIEIESIAPNPYQPRVEFNDQDIAELSQSILQHGILQPLIVSPSADGGERPYVLIMGERRLRAAKLAGLKHVSCIIRQASQQQMLEWALIENIQRSDLNPIERAHAYQQYMQRFSLSSADVAQRLGVPRTTVSNYLRILDLQDNIQKMVKAGDLSFGHAKVLASLCTMPEKQLALAKKVASSSLSVRQLEHLVEAATSGKPTSETVRGTIRPKAPYLRDVEEQLCAAVGTRITILPGRSRNTGRLVIEYYNLDDFDRITARLGAKISS